MMVRFKGDLIFLRCYEQYWIDCILNTLCFKFYLYQSTCLFLFIREIRQGFRGERYVKMINLYVRICEN